jgi:hypothetical protein
MRVGRRLVLCFVGLGILAPSAMGQSLEERFKAFLDGLRAKGQAVAPGSVVAREVTQPTITMRTDSLPMGALQSVVFVANGCSSCNGIAEKLQRHLGTVEVMNISTSQTAREAFAATGAKGVPAILIGKRLVTGYSPAVVERAMIDDINEKAGSQSGQGA